MGVVTDPAILAQLNGTGAPSSAPPLGPPPKPAPPPAPPTPYQADEHGWKAQEHQQNTAEWNATHNPDGSLKPKGGDGSMDPKTLEGQRNIAVSTIKAANINPMTGEDPVRDLIKDSTSGSTQSWFAHAYGDVTGHSTSGMENIGRLQTIGNRMVLQSMGNSLGTGISNADRDFIASTMGDIANPDIPAEQRLAAWDQVKQRLAGLAGGKIASDTENTVEYRRRIGAGESAQTIMDWLGTVGLNADRQQVEKAVQFHRDNPGIPTGEYQFRTDHTAKQSAPQSSHPADIEAIMRKYGSN